MLVEVGPSDQGTECERSAQMQPPKLPAYRSSCASRMKKTPERRWQSLVYDGLSAQAATTGPKWAVTVGLVVVPAAERAGGIAPQSH